MKSTISRILQEIENKRKELAEEYERIKKKYNFEYIKWKITFSKEQKLENKKKKRSFWQTTKSTTFREYLSIPFIYSMMIPAVILDLFLFMYQQTAMRLYRIPLVKRSDYITLERKHLDYLNWVEKLNCIYCSYVNWLFAYAVEIAWRTEKYWCPIKHAKKWLHLTIGKNILLIMVMLIDLKKFLGKIKNFIKMRKKLNKFYF